MECGRREVVMVVVVGWERKKERRSARGQMKGCSHRRVSTRVVVDLTCVRLGGVLLQLRVRGIDGCVLGRRLCA